MPASIPSDYRLSSTRKVIYVLRYLLFAGGLAIAGALAQRLFVHQDRSWPGLGLGLLAGMVVFASQLRPLRGERLLLTRTALHWLHPPDAPTIVRWDDVQRVDQRGPSVTLSLSAPPGSVTLQPRRLGAATRELTQTLQTLTDDPSARTALPPNLRGR